MCNCLDKPCCGCGPEPTQEEQQEQFDAMMADKRGERMMADLLGDDEDCDDLDESMDGDYESALASVYGELDPPEDIDRMDEDRFESDTPMGEDYGGE